MPYQPPSRNYRGQRGGYTPSGNYRPQSPANPAMHGRKRPGPGHPGSPAHGPAGAIHGADMRSKHAPKKKKLSDKIVPEAVRDDFPDSQAYMDLLALERKLDSTIMRKRLDIQEALKRPQKVKRKLRIFISNHFTPAKKDEQGNEVSKACWELKVEGRLLDEQGAVCKQDASSKHKRKFSSFFKSLVIELDKELYGPDNHLVEWHRTSQTNETDGFQVKRDGEKNVKCTMLFMLNYQPLQYRVEGRLAKLLALHTQTRPVIIQALWQYIKNKKLQDSHEREYINCDVYLQQIFNRQRIKFQEIPQLLSPLLMQPEPVVIHHTVSVDPADAKKQSCYDITVDVDDTLQSQMSTFLLSQTSQHDIYELDKKIHDCVANIKQHHLQRTFFLAFSKSPQEFICDWIQSQSADLKTMTDAACGDSRERSAEYYYQGWTHEAVQRYFYQKVQQRRLELEQALKSNNQI